MKPTITRGQRAALLFVSASAFTAWYTGVGDRIEAASYDARRSTIIIATDPQAIPDVGAVIVRDPFSDGRASSGNDIAIQPSHANATPPGAPLASGSSIEVPDIVAGAAGTTDDVGDTQSAPVELGVRATLVGPNPVAYVTSGSAMDIVRIGDLVGDSHVIKIDLEGITLSNGSRLDLAATYAATPPPRRKRRGSRALTVDDLKRLLTQRGRPAAELATTAPATLATPPHDLPSDPYATPRPIPTVDPRGLAPGTNPTPDISAPTAFPYPYPYAPPYGARH